MADTAIIPLKGGVEEKHGVREHLIDTGVQNGAPPSSSSELSLSQFRPMAAELIGTCLLSYVSVSALVLAAKISDEALSVERLLYTCFAYGSAYGAMFYALSFIHLYDSNDSRGLPQSVQINLRHLNPAISLCIYVLGALGPSRIPPEQGGFSNGTLSGDKKRFGFWDLMAYVISQALGTLAGVYIALNTVQGAFDIKTPYQTLDGVTDSMKWTSGILVSYTAILIIVVVCYTSQAKMEILNQRLHAKMLKESSSQSRHELNSLVVTGTIIACSLATISISGGYFNPFFSTWLSALSTDKYKPVLTWSPFIGSGCTILTILLFKLLGGGISFA